MKKCRAARTVAFGIEEVGSLGEEQQRGLRAVLRCKAQQAQDGSAHQSRDDDATEATQLVAPYASLVSRSV